MYNSNKTISVNNKGIVITFTDSNKHHFIKFEKQIPQLDLQYQEIEEPVFSKKQEKMYSEALYGLSIIPESVVKRMPQKILVKIATRCDLVQKAINRWKQEIVNDRMDTLLLNLFPKSPIVKQMVNIGEDDAIKCNISAKDLKLNPYLIAEKLVSLNLLPSNFFDL